MPSISIEIFKGRTLDQRRQFVQAVTNAAVDIFKVDPSAVRIAWFELDRSELARGGVLYSDIPTSTPAPAAPSTSSNGTGSPTATATSVPPKVATS